MNESFTPPKQGSNDPASKPTNSFSWIKSSFVTNPVLMGILTLIGLPLGLYGIYLSFAFNKEADPVFKVLSDVVITERRLTPKIKVYYDSVEVENVRAVTIALWNNGDAFLSKDAFSEDKPFAIRSEKLVSILNVRQVVTTRHELQFAPKRHADKISGTPADTTAKDYDYVTLAIQGDEGLEAKDGATFVILYTTRARACNWYVDARIKGRLASFKIALGKQPAIDSFKVIISCAFIFLSVYMIVREPLVGPPTASQKMKKKTVLLITGLLISFVLYFVFAKALPLYSHLMDVPSQLVP